MQVDTRRPGRQDTFDLRDQIHADDGRVHAHAEAANYASTDDEEHSVLEDDSDGDDHEEYMDEDDDGSSSLSIPNESIDFDLVYSLHSFAATVDGQANVVKGDSLFLMDDSNSYWWLVRVLKTQEVGYIPAENIETPFERLARLNKHRNVDLASATQSELQSDLNVSASRLRTALAAQTNSSSPLPPPNAPRIGNTVPNPLSQRRSLAFSPALSVHRYPPAVWNEEEWLIEREERRAASMIEREHDAEYAEYDDLEYGQDDDPEEGEWDVGGYEAEDRELADEMVMMRRMSEASLATDLSGAQQPLAPPMPMEPDDGMGWDDGAVKARQAAAGTSPPGAPPSVLAASSHPGTEPTREPQAPPELRSPRSIERLTPDPAQATETRRVTVTPSLVRDSVDADDPQERERERERKRQREEEEEEAARKRAKPKAAEVKNVATGAVMGAPVSSASLAKAAQNGGGAKLRKERESPALAEDDKDGKKKKGVFSSIFGRKSNKEKDKGKNASIGSESEFSASVRDSEDSTRRPSTGGTSADGMMSPTTAVAMQQQQQQQAVSLRNSTDPKRIQQMQQQQKERERQRDQQGTPQAAADQLRERDQQQQALYQQYLNRSPSSPPEAQPSYGLQSASHVGNSGAPSAFHSPPPSARQRPGSLILTPSSSGDGVVVPDLSVIRVFAGQNLQTEATFKTVLLNASTTSADLVRQAVQRFRLEDTDAGEYYLTVKQVEGSSAVLRDTERPLGVFEGLVESAPRVKRSSVGSVSSVASNLSMHPAIKKLEMNDFTDDSAVKFYLNRRGGADSRDGSINGGDDTLVAETAEGEADSGSGGGGGGRFLTVATQGGMNVQPERFTSPSFRFPLQLVIYPDDLPDDMVFDPLTEAIVFKDTLRERGRPSGASPGISQTLRRKIFVFPKNVTVAEVIEISLERFGIEEGVVDGGDEVEDKLSKRRSAVRVRYGLAVDIGTGQERELSPSSRVIDAFPRPPSYRAAERHNPNKRRSVDSAQILGTLEDVNPEDPMFILRRATSYRSSTNARHRVSTGLDEIALQRLHRDSASSAGSDVVASEEPKPKVVALSLQEIIAAQREATRANQRAILSASTNSVRGMDVVFPDNAMIRSARYDTGDKMRYSYVQPDGESYDISDIVEEEWRDSDDKNDVLQGVLGRNKDRIGEKLDRVLTKIQSGGHQQQTPNAAPATSLRSNSPDSQYSLDDGASRSRSVTPGSAALVSRTPIPARDMTPQGRSSPSVGRPGTSTPTGAKPAPTVFPGLAGRRQASITSVMSDDVSGYATPAASSPERRTPTPKAQQQVQQKRLVIPKDDFGVSYMMAVIQFRGSVPRKALPPLDPVDEMLFGRPVDMGTLHPKLRDVYADALKHMDDMDKLLDEYILQAGRP
ncbi:hypothetical protein B0H17DRAFT_1157378 [Mycena rosella]|uniref:SH3 domain-containing protein n=1 Tax=Mycena rosella TaxID=1033263 RepID=A0AAD7E0U0_MYCRO|nr:hypothetical protein B0H17DRAFT_1157378 [Mycena rosella]